MTSGKWILAMIVTLMVAFPVSNTAQETRVGGELWNRWTYETGKSTADSSNVLRKNYFALERGYLDIRTKFSESTSTRFTVDMFSTDMAGFSDGAGLKLKYGFVDFNDITPIPDLTITAGLQKVFFGTIYDWNYTLIGKSPVGEYKISSSADFGLTANGFLPDGWGEYAFGIYNGEGYKVFGRNLKDNTDFAYLANLRLTPIAGITVGGSYMHNTVEREKKLTDNSINDKYQQQNLMAGVARFAFGPLDLWAEFLSKDVKHHANHFSKDYTATGLMIMPIVSLYKLTGTDIQVIGRYDRWDQTDNAADKYLRTDIIGGVNYTFVHDASANPRMQLQLNLTNRTYDEDKSAASYANQMKDINQVMLQLKYRFSATIK